MLQRNNVVMKIMFCIRLNQGTLYITRPYRPYKVENSNSRNLALQLTQQQA